MYHRNTKTTQENSSTRRDFLKKSSTLAIGIGLLSLREATASPNSEPDDRTLRKKQNANNTMIRTITYNVFNGCIGYKGVNGSDLPSGEDSILVRAARDMGQIPKRIALELALYQPNIINLSEAPQEHVVAEMAKMLELKYVFFSGAKNELGNFPGSILTDYEVISSENRPFVNKEQNNPKELFTRHWGKAKLRTPNGQIITVHSAHLWPFKKVPKDTKIRLKEIKEIKNSIKYDLANGSDSVLLQGDLNQIPGTPEYERLNNGELFDVFIAGGKEGGYTINSISPTRRIDYIFCAGELSKQVKDCRSLYAGNFRMNTEDPRGYALSDHLPVLADFE